MIFFHAGTSAHAQIDAVAPIKALVSVPDPYPHVGFYNNAEGSPVFQMIHSASQTLDIEIYLMTDLDIRVAIRDALARHVKVRVVKEAKPIGDPCRMFVAASSADAPDCADQKKLKDEIIAAGGEYIAFAKDTLCANPHKPCFMHGKMVVSDQNAVMISTGNFNSSNLCNLSQKPEKCNRDFSVVSRDSKIISFLATIFDNDVKAASYDLAGLFDDILSAELTVSPLSLDPLVNLIKSAKVSIDLENQYLKEPTINAALIERASHGVKVNMTIASACSFGRPTAHDKLQIGGFMTAFEQAGVSVKMMPSQFKIDGKPAYLHAKAIVIDGKHAWVGSVNGSSAATSNNREFGMFLDDETDVAAIEKILVGDHNSVSMETWQDSLNCKKDRSILHDNGDSDG